LKVTDELFEKLQQKLLCLLLLTTAPSTVHKAQSVNWRL